MITELPTRFLKLLKVAQPVKDATGMLGQNAIRGIFVQPGVITSMNGRMLIQLQYRHGLEDGQYTIEGYTLKKSKYNQGFTPRVFSGIPTKFNVSHHVTGALTAGELSLFALQNFLVPDFGDCTKVLDVLRFDFSDADHFFYCRHCDKIRPFMLSSVGLHGEYGIRTYCMQYPYRSLDQRMIEIEIEEV